MRASRFLPSALSERKQAHPRPRSQRLRPGPASSGGRLRRGGGLKPLTPFEPPRLAPSPRPHGASHTRRGGGRPRVRSKPRKHPSPGGARGRRSRRGACPPGGRAGGAGHPPPGAGPAAPASQACDRARQATDLPRLSRSFQRQPFQRPPRGQRKTAEIRHSRPRPRAARPPRRSAPPPPPSPESFAAHPQPGGADPALRRRRANIRPLFYSAPGRRRRRPRRLLPPLPRRAAAVTGGGTGKPLIQKDELTCYCCYHEKTW